MGDTICRGVNCGERLDPDLIQWLEAEARAAGFDRVGIAAVEGADEDRERRDGARFAQWVAVGHAGEMEYLKRRDEAGELLRSSVRVPMAWARSVVVCAMNYNVDGPLSIDAADPGAGWIARYAWSGRRDVRTGEIAPSDYHDDLLGRLRSLEAKLGERTGAQTRSYVDTGPVVERSLAARAGVGWIGKNTCVLNQEMGSWLLLATLVTSVPMAAEAVAADTVDRCGSCTRCLDACPTGALIAPQRMDARRCISYLTIEKKGRIAEELREGMGRQIFGCDICQDVCPWNRRAPIASEGQIQPRRELIDPDLEELAGMQPADFKRRFRGSPVERTGLKRLRRNVAIAMGNSREQRFAARLEAWSGAEDPVLAETAEWARSRLDRRQQEVTGTEETAESVAVKSDPASASISKA